MALMAIMNTGINETRKHTIEKILSLQDHAFRWGFDEKKAREQPQYMYYSPNYKSTLWTLVLLADLKAAVDITQIQPSIRLITERFYDPQHGIFSLPNESHFPIPCLNGNMIYLHQYFQTSQPEIIETALSFFATYQRFDDGDFKTPSTYPYCANNSCYGKHSCYWGVIKLFKGISFIPENQRSAQAKQLIESCIDFILQHEVCFSSHRAERFLHRDIDKLTFPNFYKSDVLEILWLLARESVRDSRTYRALDFLRSKSNPAGFWELEKSINTVASIGQKDCANAFITERATEVLDYYGR